jgi:hypothetical protein
MTGMSSHFNLILTEMMGNILLLMQIEALETFTLFTVFLFIAEEYMAVTTMLSYGLRYQTSGINLMMNE